MPTSAATSARRRLQQSDLKSFRGKAYLKPEPAQDNFASGWLNFLLACFAAARGFFGTQVTMF
jgi:hypothetical protein